MPRCRLTTLASSRFTSTRWSFATPHVGARFRSKRKRSSETCIKISVTESVLQRCERWLPGAVARRNAFDLERIFQTRHHLGDDIVRRDDEVKTACNQMNFGIDSRRCLDNLLSPFRVPRLPFPHSSHLHVRTHIHMPALHGVHGVSAAITLHPGHTFHVRHVVARHIHARHLELAFLILLIFGLLLRPSRRQQQCPAEK